MTAVNFALNPTRTDLTEAQYLIEGRKLAGKVRKLIGSNANLLDVVRWFQSTDEQYSKSSIRKHRANLSALVRNEVAADLIKQADFNECIRLLQPENAPRPLDKKNKRTSARKARSVSAEDLEHLRDYLYHSSDRQDRFLFKIITELCFFFCRPSELTTLTIRGNDVVFSNAKTTNGRGCGQTRTFKNAVRSKGRRNYLERFRAELAESIAKAGGWKPLSQALSSRLARRCAKLKIKRLSFYSFRHVGMATAKSIFPVEAVAALSGHASNRTAVTNYAKRRSGLKFLGEKMLFRPSEENIELVRQHENWKRPELPKRALCDDVKKESSVDFTALNDGEMHNDENWVQELLEETETTDAYFEKKRAQERQDNALLAKLDFELSELSSREEDRRAQAADEESDKKVGTGNSPQNDQLRQPSNRAVSDSDLGSENVDSTPPDGSETSGPKF